MRSAGDYRAMARESLRGKWGPAIGAVLLYGLILGALSSTGIGSILIGGPLAVGISLFFIRLTRKQNASVNTLFEPFNNFVNTFIMYLLKSIFLMLWSLLFIIPGIIKSYSYAMSEYIMSDDASVSGSQAIDISKKMMDGRKMQLFVLQLSFIGWILIPCAVIIFGSILAVFAPGLGMTLMIIGSIALIPLAFFIGPYMYAATAAFYEDAKYEYFQSGNGPQNQSNNQYNQNQYQNPNQFNNQYQNPSQFNQRQYQQPYNPQGQQYQQPQQQPYQPPQQPGPFSPPQYQPPQQQPYQPPQQPYNNNPYGNSQQNNNPYGNPYNPQNDRQGGNNNNNNPPPNPF